MKKDKGRAVIARRLRRRQTEAEKALWARLRGKRFEGLKFRRQQPIGSYIVDFVSFEKKLVIEIDGGQHSEGRTREKDKKRTAWLEGEGYRVLRFWNNEVLINLEGVLEELRQVSPSP